MAEHDFAIDLIDIERVEPAERNPQQGDIGAIATAIAVDGWHGTIICQWQGARKPPKLIAGEHRWRALHMIQEHGITLDGEHVTYDDLLGRKGLLLPPKGKIPGQVLKVDDVQALRKLVADNRASGLALVDEQVLADILEELAAGPGGLPGSLFDGDDMDALHEALERAARGFDTTNEVRTPADRADEYAAAGIRSVILPMEAAEYDALIARLTRLRTAWGLESNTEVVVRAVADAADHADD